MKTNVRLTSFVCGFIRLTVTFPKNSFSQSLILFIGFRVAYESDRTELASRLINIMVLILVKGLINEFRLGFFSCKPLLI